MTYETAAYLDGFGHGVLLTALVIGLVTLVVALRERKKR